MYHHMKEVVEEKKLSVEWISSADILADGLVNALLTGTFRKPGDKWDFNQSENLRLYRAGEQFFIKNKKYAKNAKN